MEMAMPKQTFHNLPVSKQKAIIDAAIVQFGRRPFEYANISEIIRAAGISRGSFYQYFTDKEDLFKTVLDLIGKIKTAYYGNLFDFESDMPFFDRLEALYRGGVGFAADHPEFVLLTRQITSSSDPCVLLSEQQSIESAHMLFANLIRADIVKGRLRPDVDPSLLATLVTDVMTRIMLGKYLKDPLDPEQFGLEITQLINIFRKGTEPHV